MARPALISNAYSTKNRKRLQNVNEKQSVNNLRMMISEYLDNIEIPEYL
jgi:hypothetical protein